MANSKFRKALEHSLQTDEERQIIRDFYDMSYGDFLAYYASGLNELIAATEAGRTRIKDRPYQLDNIRYRKTKIDGGQEVRGFITPLPAGGGKTEIFSQGLFRTAKEATVGDRVRHITPPMAIIVPSVDLADQVYGELSTRFPDLLIGRKDGTVTNIQPLTIYVINSFMIDVQSGFIQPRDLKLNIIDEAHRFLSGDRAREFRRFLGVALIDTYSASPVFTNRPTNDPNRGLYDLLGEDSIIPSPTNRQLTEMGFLAPCHNVIQKIQLKSEDIPEEIRSSPDKLHDFLTILKTKAAIEFYKTYEDPETGQRARGKPAIGFSRYIRDAQISSVMFREAMEALATNDNEMADILSQYSDYSVVVSRSLGNRSVREAMDRVLPLEKIPPERRKNPQPRALLVETASMLREGFDAPHLKVALGHNTGPIVDQIQTRGRVRREVKALNPKTGLMERQLSFVLDQVVEIDGELLGNPCLYYVAIDDPSVVKGVMTIPIGEETIGLPAAEVLEYKNQDEMRALVLGKGSAVSRKGDDFDAIWDKLQKHIYGQSNKPKPTPTPYILDGEPVKAKIVTVNGEIGESEESAKSEVRISRTAIDQFRGALGIPGQINGLWLSRQGFEEAVIGKYLDEQDEEVITGRAVAAKYYQAPFRKALTPALRHLEIAQTKPYMIGGKAVIMQHRLNDYGDLVPAFHSSAVQIFKEELDVLPYLGLRYLSPSEFTDAVLDHVDNPNQYKAQLETLLKQAEAFYTKNHKPGQKTNFPVGESKIEVSKCINDDVEFKFCIAGPGIRVVRQALGIPGLTFDIDGVKWSVDESDIRRITKQTEKERLENKGEDWKSIGEFAKLINMFNGTPTFLGLWDGIQALYDETQISPIIDGHEIKCGYREDGSGRKWFCLHQSETDFFSKKLGRDNLEAKTSEWNSRTEFAGRLRTSPQSPKFSAFWDQCEKTFKHNPSQPVVIDGHTILCGNKRAGLHVRFCIHESESDWFKQKLGKNVEPKGECWQTKNEFYESIGISYVNEAANTLWQECLNQYEKAPLSPVIVKQHIVQCGNKSSGNVIPFCLHVDEREWFKANLGLSIELTNEWKNQTEFASLLEVRTSNEEYVRLSELIKETYILAPAEPVVVEGHEVKCVVKISGNRSPLYLHESEVDWFKEKIALYRAERERSPVTRQAKFQKETFDLLEKGYRTIAETEVITGISKKTIWQRAKAFNPEADYTVDGRSAEPGQVQVTVKGCEVVKYAAADDIWLLSGGYVEAMAEAEKLEKHYKELGYKPIAHALEITGYRSNVTLIKCAEEAATEQMEKKEPRANDLPLTYRNPYSNQIFFNPDLIERVRGQSAQRKAAQEQEKELLGTEYVTFDDAAILANLPRTLIQQRSNDIKSDKNYTINGREPKPDEDSVKGNQLVTRAHERTLLRHSLVEGWIAAEAEFKQLRELGYKDSKEAAAILGIDKENIKARARRIALDKDYAVSGRKPRGEEAVVKGATIRWNHPYNNKILLFSPGFIEGQAKADETVNELQKQGYKCLKEVMEMTGLSEQQIRIRIKRKEEQSEDSIPIYSHPYSHLILFRPTLIESWKEEMAKQNTWVESAGIGGQNINPDSPHIRNRSGRSRSKKE